MRKKIMLILAILALVSCVDGNTENVDYAKIHELIKVLKTKDRNKIAEIIKYPIMRDYPLEEIESKEEFVKLYDEIIDDEIINTIIYANPKKSWNEIGWRGIAFENGLVWLDENYRIRVINYITEKGNAKYKSIVNEIKASLPLEIREFDIPVLDKKGERYRVRVDEIGNTYRLVVWDSNEILLIIHNGKWIPDGNMGACHYDWENEGKIYRVENGFNKDGILELSYCIYQQKELVENIEALPVYSESIK